MVTDVPAMLLFGVACIGAILIVVAVVVVAMWSVCRLRPREDGLQRRSVTVLVLGDFGRSPRMQYHCVSLAKLPRTVVDVVGYGGTDPIDEIAAAPSTFRLHMMRPPPALPKSAPKIVFLLYAPFKVLYQVVQMVWTLSFSVSRPSHILIQNPPSIPTLPVAAFVAALHGARLVVDWHNYGYTILGLSLGSTHPVVKLAWAIESVFGRLGTSHFCVTDAMREDLRVNWGVNARTLHDRPPPFFRPTPVSDVGQLFARIPATSVAFDGSGACGDGGTALTNGTGHLRSDRPAILVSSTSWTPDEDFAILLAALQDYEIAREAEPLQLPRLLCIITGKGPLKAFYEKKISEMHLVHVKIATAWLTAADYPVLLGAANLGVSLHTSSSGLDLPMKVVDMFGCALPVCAKQFSCLHELVKDGINGVTFDTSAQLGVQIVDLLRGFPNNTQQLDKLRTGLKAFRENGWERNWTAEAAPTFSREKRD
eukprot:m.105259 g.105259  ORF g.105259 m.105259 type:complete len:481 (-) comp21003_c0_seq1:67-1509(-)